MSSLNSLYSFSLIILLLLPKQFYSYVIPTNTTTDLEIYDAFRDYDFKSKSIACAKSQCQVICDTRYACRDVHIHTINITTSLQVKCLDYDSCSFANVYCPSKGICDIICKDTKYNACQNMNIMVDNQYNNISIDCDQESLSVCGNTHINCIAGGSTKLTSPLWGCETDKCCPLSLYNDVIKCSNSPCIIDCVIKDCNLYLINGSSVSELTVNCGYERCISAHIICPKNNYNSTCNINCKSINSCRKMLVKGENTHSLSVSCKGSRSCWSSQIIATSAHFLYLDCAATTACPHMNIYCPYNNLNSCNIECGRFAEACEFMFIHVDDDFVNGYLNLHCPSSDFVDACKIYFECNADGSANKYQAHIIYTQSDYQCEISQQNNPLYCCPWQDTLIQPELPNVQTNDPTQLSHIPTNTPTNNPAPITITINPSVNPATIQTIHQSRVTNSHKINARYIIIGVLSFILICFVLICIIKRKHNKKKIIDINNGLVAIISIGEYDSNVFSNNKECDFDGYVEDIPVENDSINIHNLFGDYLNYKVLPTKEESQLNWKEDEIITFLKEDINNELYDKNNNNELKYDGLIVCISSHGLQNNII
eukprot:477434_1